MQYYIYLLIYVLEGVGYMKKFLFYFFAVLTVIGVITVLVLNFSYSDGVRSGRLVKLSKKGVLLSTYEGTLDLGSGDQLTWDFSIHDDDIGDELLDYTGKEVTLTYKEHLYELFYKTKFNVVEWEISDGENGDINGNFCKLVGLIRTYPKMVTTLREDLESKDLELLEAIRKCQKDDK